jgi:hypothetical protein
MCFGCNGSGKQQSRNGKARRREYDARMKAACEISAYFILPGDVIRLPHLKRWTRVEGVTINRQGMVAIELAKLSFVTGGMIQRHPGTERVHGIMQTVAKKKGAEIEDAAARK